MNANVSIPATDFLSLMGRAKWRILLVFFARIKTQSRLLTAVLGTFLLGYLGAAYFLFFKGLQFVNGFPLVGTLISQRILYLLFAFFFLMLVFSNLIIGYSTLFRNRETAWLLTLPVDHRNVLRWKYLECLAVSSWALVFLSAPLLLAYGRLYEVSWSFYVFMPLLYLPFLVIPAALGVLGILLMVRLLAHPWLGKGLLAFALLVAAFLIFRIEPATAETAAGGESMIFEKLLRSSRVVISPWLPSTWLVQSLLSWRDGTYGTAWFYFGVLLSNGLMILLVGVAGFSRLFYGSYGAAVRLQASRQAARGRAISLRLPLTERLARALPFDRQFAALVLKDARTFWRDPAQWIQCVIFFGLLALYFANLRNSKLDFENPFWPTLIGYLNLAAASLTLSTLTTRFIFPQFSLEGKRLWILGLAPLGLDRVVRQKFWTSAIASAVVTVPLMILSGVILGQSPARVFFFIVAALCMGSSLSGLAAGLGAIFPNLREDNPTKIVSGFGGTLCLVGSFLYILVFILLIALPGMRLVMDPSSRLGPWTQWLLPAAFLWTVANTFLPLWLAEKRVKNLEF
ncbi:MAG TPA: hypothetical protein VF585_10245 [Chthoniobacterales bacterium]|jgi:ABC-2 type transport system permease protein